MPRWSLPAGTAGARSGRQAKRLRIAYPTRPKRNIPETRREAAAMAGCINDSLRFGWVACSRIGTGQLQIAVFPRRHRIRRLEAAAEMGQITKSAGQCDLCDGFPREQGIEQVAPGLFKPP